MLQIPENLHTRTLKSNPDYIHNMTMPLIHKQSRSLTVNEKMALNKFKLEFKFIVANSSIDKLTKEEKNQLTQLNAKIGKIRHAQCLN